MGILKKLIKNLTIWGGAFAIIFGTLLHFFYEWSGNNLNPPHLNLFLDSVTSTYGIYQK